MTHRRIAALFIVTLLLSACNITAGTPYPTSYTGGPPPVVYDIGKSDDNAAPCCCENGTCPVMKKKMDCCCKGGTCPVTKKKPDCTCHKGKHYKKSKQKHHHGHHAPTATGSAYDDVMDKMHAAMAAAPVTGDVDVDFAAGMIPHHQGAIDMAEVVLEQGTDPKLRRLAREIIVAQKREIAFMEYWLQTRGQTPDSNIVNVRPHH